MAPGFCAEANSSIYFLPSGCVEWIGKRKKVWGPGKYILRPVFQKVSAPQNLLHILYYFTGDGIESIAPNRMIYMTCGNPLCVNPDHMAACSKEKSIFDLYPDYVREGVRPVHKRVMTYVISKDNLMAKEFTCLNAASRWLRGTVKVIRRYVRTGRLYRGKWYIRRERYDLEESEIEEHYSQEYSHESGDFTE